MKPALSFVLLEAAFAVSIGQAQQPSIAQPATTKPLENPKVVQPASQPTQPQSSGHDSDDFSWTTPTFDDIKKYLENQQYQLVSYLGFEYEGPGVGEMFSSLSEDDMTEIKNDLELLIFHKWSVAQNDLKSSDEDEAAPKKGLHLAEVERGCGGCGFRGGCCGFGRFGCGFPWMFGRPWLGCCGFYGGCGGCYGGIGGCGAYAGCGGYGGCGAYGGYGGYGNYGGYGGYPAYGGSTGLGAYDGSVGYAGYNTGATYGQTGCYSGVCYGGSACPSYAGVGVGANPQGTDGWVDLGTQNIAGVNTYGSANVYRTNVTDINTIVNNVVRNNILQRYVDAPGQSYSQYVNQVPAGTCTPTCNQYC